MAVRGAGLHLRRVLEHLGRHLLQDSVVVDDDDAGPVGRIHAALEGAGHGGTCRRGLRGWGVLPAPQQ